VTRAPFEPRRLKETGSRPGSPDGRLAQRLRTLSVYVRVPPLRPTTRRPRRRRVLLMVARLAIVFVILTTAVGGAGATLVFLIGRWPAARGPERPSAPTEPPSPAAPRTRSMLTPRESTAQPPTPPLACPLPPEAVVVTPPPLPRPPVRRPLHLAEPPPREAPPETAPARADGLVAEAGLLRQALRALREEKDHERALALLDEYASRFPRGVLGAEASSVRVQALFPAGKTREALAILDQMRSGPDELSHDLRVLRGELRSIAGRCAEALVDFDSVLGSGGARPEETARALYGRASCRARTGDVTGAERDRQRYLTEYPTGPAVNQLRPSP